MMHYLVILLLCILGGCTSQSATERFQAAKPHVDVKEVDLTLPPKPVNAKPLVVAKKPMTVKAPVAVKKSVKDKTQVAVKKTVKAKAPVAAKKSAKTHAPIVVKKPVSPPVNAFTVMKGETYRAALIRWLKSKGYKGVAWAIQKNTDQALRNVASENERYEGDVVKSLSEKLSVNFKISTNRKLKYAAVHEWQDFRVNIVEVRGRSLRDVIKNLVTDFGWNWNDKQSWRSSKELHGFSIPFPVVAPSHDIGLVLSQVLKNRPVRAEYHEGTQTVFITDDK